ncbi:MAG TPA: hypothetical protein VJ777_17520 [Mycobacterium sp.]|nr:hypothetical protein [Mycobacterium sp.]
MAVVEVVDVEEVEDEVELLDVVVDSPTKDGPAVVEVVEEVLDVDVVVLELDDVLDVEDVATVEDVEDAPCASARIPAVIVDVGGDMVEDVDDDDDPGVAGRPSTITASSPQTSASTASRATNVCSPGESKTMSNWCCPLSVAE